MSISHTPVRVKFTSPIAANTLPTVTTMMHTKSFHENFSSPRPTMKTFSTTG